MVGQKCQSFLGNQSHQEKQGTPTTDGKVCLNTHGYQGRLWWFKPESSLRPTVLLIRHQYSRLFQYERLLWLSPFSDEKTEVSVRLSNCPRQLLYACSCVWTEVILFQSGHWISSQQNGSNVLIRMALWILFLGIQIYYASLLESVFILKITFFLRV